MPDDRAIRFLLSSSDPSVRLLAHTDVLGASPRSAAVRGLRRAVPGGPRVRALLAGQRADGGFGVHPYRKWTGAHWRLVSLVELAVPPRLPQALRAADQVLGWLLSPAHRTRIMTVNGRVRRCASQEGNALRACVHFGLAGDRRVQALVRDLVGWQWPDGGWNCDRNPEAKHSSFHESLIPLWALAAYREETSDRSVDDAVDRGAEFFLRHRLFRSERTGRPIVDRTITGRPRPAEPARSPFLRLAYPPYWHYDILTGLRVLAHLGRLADPRMNDALDIVEGKRRSDGLWRADVAYWRRGKTGTHVEVADWGRGSAEMLTLNALRVLRSAGRLELIDAAGS
jgi:hypothetical protein